MIRNVVSMPERTWSEMGMPNPGYLYPWHELLPPIVDLYCEAPMCDLGLDGLLKLYHAIHRPARRSPRTG